MKSYSEINREGQHVPVFGIQKYQNNLALVMENSYEREEFLKEWGNIPGANYLLNYKPEILNHKKILTAIKNTNRVGSLTLEGEGSKGFVIGFSDICLKLKNHGIDVDFHRELKNYILIENIFNQYMGGQKEFHIPEIQRSLCSKDVIAMEYLPGISLSHLFIMKEHNIKSEQFIEILENKNNDTIIQIADRLNNSYNNLMERLKNHEVRILLLACGINEDEIEGVGILDVNFLIEYTGSEDMNRIYKKWQKVLKDNGIKNIDDHGENLKIHNNILYGLDFGNIIFNSKRY